MSRRSSRFRRRLRGFAALCLPLLLSTGAAHGYTRLAEGSTPQPVYLTWDALPVVYQLNGLTDDDLPNVANGSDPLLAVARAFQSWNEVPTATARCEFGQLTGRSAFARDGVNLVSFVDHAFAFNVGTLAVSLVFREVASGRILEADMLFNPAVAWSTRDPVPGTFDVQQVATHEAGHFLGLGHSALHSATMYPFTREGSQIERFLDPDDLAALSEAYPTGAYWTQLGSIEGQVTRGGAAVFGAHVVVVDERGRPVASALTLKDGSYRISGLATGRYEVYAEPLDGPVTQGNLGGYWSDAGFAPSFGARILSRTIDVTAGASSTGHEIVVGSSAPTLNPRYIGLQPVGGGGFGVDGILRTVLQGQTWNVVVGGEGLVAPTTFEIAGPGVSRRGGFVYGTFNNGVPYVKAHFDFAADAVATPRLITVARGEDTVPFSGPLEILPDPAVLHVVKDALFPGTLHVFWYGGSPPYLLQRDTLRDFRAPVEVYEATDVDFHDGVLTHGLDYFYRLTD